MLSKRSSPLVGKLLQRRDQNIQNGLLPAGKPLLNKPDQTPQTDPFQQQQLQGPFEPQTTGTGGTGLSGMTGGVRPGQPKGMQTELMDGEDELTRRFREAFKYWNS